MKTASLLAACAVLLSMDAAHAQVIASTPRGIVVAHDGVIELHEARARTPVWRSEGLHTPMKIVTGASRVAILDPVSNEVRIVNLANGRGETFRSGESPIDGVFAGDDLFVLARDSRRLERFRSDGSRTTVAVAADAAFLQQAGGSLYVYGRVDGVLQEVTTAPFAVRAESRVAPFAAGLEIDGRDAYLVYPREGKIRAHNLETFKVSGEWRVGSVPVDLTFAGGGTALTARVIAVADPSSKRVWMVEGTQSSLAAFGRGFIRGLLGLGLFGGRKSQFATGIDRVAIRGRHWIAYDSSSATLYRFTKKGSTVLAKGVLPNSFAVTEQGAAWWSGGTLVAERN